jgi:predicted molibdopterin-dependent oxidoreductase YjgC
MYDDGVTTRHAASISGLVNDSFVRINPRDASMLAVEDGSTVELAGTILMPARLDPEVSEGSVVVPFNVEATKGLAASASLSVRAVRGEG